MQHSLNLTTEVSRSLTLNHRLTDQVVNRMMQLALSFCPERCV